DEELDRLASCADIRPVATERLPQRAHDHVDLAGEAGLRDRASAAWAERARGVCLIHHEPASMPPRQLEEPGDWRDVTVHREEGVRDHQSAPPRGLREPPGEMLEVAMAV